MMNYAAARQIKENLDKQNEELGAKLRAYPSGPMGLTPDAIKATDAWKADYRAFHISLRHLQRYNREFMKLYGKQYRADMRKEREAKWQR
jgi:hypothetical protein